MRLRRLALAPVLILVAAACGGGGPTSSPLAGSTSPTAQLTASPSARVIAVTLTDALRIEPAEMTVKAGQPVTFVVTNTGANDHEFYLGGEAAQAEHEAEMASMGGMMPHDEENGIAVESGETKELTYTFDLPGDMVAGCHVTGHYGGGMRASITVTE